LVWRDFNPKKLNSVEFREKYQVKVSKLFAPWMPMWTSIGLWKMLSKISKCHLKKVCSTENRKSIKLGLMKSAPNYWIKEAG
jgi:hypothetical protein